MKPRTPGSIEDALTIICGVLGIDKAAQIVGKSESHVRGWTDPDNDREIGLKQAMKLEAECIRMSGQKPLTSVWVRAMNAIAASEGPQIPAEPMPESTMDIMMQVGQVAETVRAALADNHICRADKIAVLRACEAMRKEVEDLEHSVRTAFQLHNNIQEPIA